ncbi:T-cell surface antigen CD2-like isoform X2 [Tachysurus fulvidraco]|uniref:T-cell surface antigen CD2-like isoform X2 n=1 Tax=Tachysurus fulvidraco TaxID=1234273 RepID=UPI001FEE357F|nr:T-cell surface antigen CD2-like isoform X2 [Tachysurus fulvidraco]XP_026988534.2 T-cell surface antigen CD2-like isoform X2 [Tachysurus fulvidraco]
MNTNVTVTALSLCFLTLFSLTDCSTCDINTLEGETLSFKLTDSSLKDNDRFTIKKDNQVLVPKRNRKQDGPGIMDNSFMKFPDVKLNSSGSYTVEVFDGQGRNLNSYTQSVCVYAKVPKPRVNITCQDGKIDIICDVEDSKDLSFSWEKNGEDFKTNAKVLRNVESDKSNYSCTAQNPVDNNTSDSVEASCNKVTLFGFDLRIMVSILAGGGTLVLLLIIVLVTFSCRSWSRKDKHHRVPDQHVLTDPLPTESS